MEFLAGAVTGSWVTIAFLCIIAVILKRRKDTK